ncbi:hypothetical protein [Pseudomonas koreensis]|uniref:Uncharacterized protein n=1 Tax=Pseudomonas koreensis TaxID=198620 RepID=A0A9X2XHB9_9PSED|nr:hypothetical protein [Pseudomonas koreensis]MCU7248940.1 hypothetical protein [Pseudomonas koreensis]
MPTIASARLKSAIATALPCLFLAGCVGVTVSLPETTTRKTEAFRALDPQSSSPPITRTTRSPLTREWCGITVWVAVIPVPMKLPVCSSYSEQSFGNDGFGDETLLLYSQQKVPSPLYACGPFMVLGPIIHGYQGNTICGVFPD